MALHDLWVRIRGDKKDLDKTLDGAKTSVKGFAGTIMAAATAGAAAFAILVSWFKATDQGARTMNVTFGVTKQLLTDLITGQGFHIKEAIKNANAQSKINEDNAKEAYQVTKMQSELNILIRDASDQTKTHGEKLALLTKAMEKEAEIKKFLLADAKEELKVAWDHYKINQGNTTAREAYWKAAQKVAEVEGMDSRRLQSMFTGELKAQADRAADLVDAFTPVPPLIESAADRAKRLSDELEKVKEAAGEIEKAYSQVGSFVDALAKPVKGGGMARGGATLAGAPITPSIEMSDIQKQWIDSWRNATDQVTNMIEDAFISLFEHIGSGSMEGFGDELLRSFGNLVANLGKMLVSLGTTMLFALQTLQAPTIPTAIAAIAAGAAAMAIGGMMMGASSRGASSLGSGSSGGGTGGYNAQSQRIEVYGRIEGKHIAIASKRWYEDNG